MRMSELSRFVYFEAFWVSFRKRIKGRKTTHSFWLSATFQLNENKHVKHKLNEITKDTNTRKQTTRVHESSYTSGYEKKENLPSEIKAGKIKKPSIHKPVNGT